MLQDLKFALRGMRRAPMFYAGAALILGLGIGLSTATFGVFHSVLLRPLPIAEQDRLVVLTGAMPGARPQVLPLNRRMLSDLARTSRTLSGVSGVGFDGPWTWYARDPADARQSVVLHASVVTGSFFPVLGVKPEVGRTLLPDDDAPGAAKVAVISHELWAREYGGAADIVGKQLVDQSSSAAYTIVGVMPAGLAFERGTEVWRPLNAQFPILADSDLDNIFAMVRVVGRLRPGATVAAAREEMAGFMRRAMSDRNPSLAPHLEAEAHPLVEEVVGDIRPALRIIAAAVTILLLIACLNVANLMLIRASLRTPELAVRACLGASRLRLVRQLLSEGLVLAAAGGALGVLIAWGALHVVVALAPAGLPRIGETQLDSTTLIASIGISLFTVLLFALGPALNISSGELHTYTRSGSRSVTSSRRGRVRRQSLVVAQIALAVMVIASAGLLGRTLEQLQHLSLGFDADRLDAIEVRVPEDAHYTALALNDLMERLAARTASLPNVAGVAAGIRTPFSNGGIEGWVSAEGESAAEHASDPYTDLEFVTPNYFQTLGVRVLRGRAFDDGDARSGVPVVVVSENVARHYWPGQDAIGKRLHCMGGAELCAVVGVVEETRYVDLVKPHLTIYRPSRQAPVPVFAPRMLLIRTTGDPVRMMTATRAAITQAEPAATLGRVVPVAELIGPQLAQPRLIAMLVAVFAASALVLASAGIFGVLIFHVALRTRELGIRQALGATPRELGLMLLREGLLLQAIGIAAGIAISLVATQSLRSLLYAVTPTDPLSLLGAAGVLLVCGLAAVLVPARRGARIDPAVALRSE